MSQQSIQTQSAELVTAVAQTTASIKILCGDERLHMHPVEVIALINSFPISEIWEWKPKKQGVYWLRTARLTADPRPELPFVECYRNTESATFAPWPGAWKRYETRPSL